MGRNVFSPAHFLISSNLRHLDPEYDGHSLGQIYGKKSAVYQWHILLLPHLVVTCWLLVGQITHAGNPTTDVYRYDSHTDSWHVISQMKNKRSYCLAVTLPEDRLIVAGGWIGIGVSDIVEILEDEWQWISFLSTWTQPTHYMYTTSTIHACIAIAIKKIWWTLQDPPDQW